VHYLIHSYDKPQLAQLGLPAARRYAQIAPGRSACAAYAVAYLCSTRTLAGRHRSNLASIAATRKTTAMHMGGEGHQFHAMDFLVSAYMQSGREADALKVIEESEGHAVDERHVRNGIRSSVFMRWSRSCALMRWRCTTGLKPLR